MTIDSHSHVLVPAPVGEKELSGPDYEQFRAAEESLGAVVIIHPYSFTEPPRFGISYISTLLAILWIRRWRRIT